LPTKKTDIKTIIKNKVNIMTKKEIAKFRTQVKRNSQPLAITNMLSAGYQFSVDDAMQAGIADPRRVVNRLRQQHKLPITQDLYEVRGGKTVKRYSLSSKKTR